MNKTTKHLFKTLAGLGVITATMGCDRTNNYEEPPVLPPVTPVTKTMEFNRDSTDYERDGHSQFLNNIKYKLGLETTKGIELRSVPQFWDVTSGVVRRMTVGLTSAIDIDDSKIGGTDTIILRHTARQVDKGSLAEMGFTVLQLPNPNQAQSEPAGADL